MQIQSTAQSKNTQKFCFGFQSKNVYIIYFIYIKQTKVKIINYLRKKLSLIRHSHNANITIEVFCS